MLRYEAWPLPGSATFEKKFDIPEALPGSSGVRELSDWSDGTLFLPASYSKLSSLVSETVGSLIRVYLGSTLIDEFDAARVERSIDRPGTVVVSGPQRNGLVEGIATLPRNYPEHKAGAMHWKWGAENVIPDLPLGSLGSIREVWQVHHDHTSGSWSASVDGDSDTIAFNATAAQVEGNSETLSPPGSGFQGLTTVNDVTVSGAGSAADPYIITFYDPPDPTTVTLTVGTLSGGSTFSATKLTEGQLDPAPITISKPVDAGAGATEGHGTYDDPALQVNTQAGNIDTGADWSARVNALTRYAGCQLVVDVTPGATYSNVNVRVKPNSAGDFTLVIRDIYENRIARKSDVALSAGSFQDLTINTLTIPAGVNQVIVRVAATDATPANIDTFWVNWQGATMLEGEPEATFTEIVDELLDAAHARDTATFLELDATAAADSLGTALSDINFTAHVGDKRNLSHVLADGKAIGYQWDVVPAADALIITPAAGTTHVLQIYYVDSDEIEDLTVPSGGPSVLTGSHVSDAQLVTRRAPYTTLIGLGAGSVYAEDTNATAEAGIGRIEQVRDVDHLASSTSVQAFLDASFAEEARNRDALTATVLESVGQVPLVDYGPGSKIWWQFPGIHSKEARPVKRIGYVHGTQATFQLQGSRILSGDAAMASALDRLLRQPGRRRDDKPLPSPSSLAGVGGGEFINVVRDRGATGDGSTDDTAALQSALDSAEEIIANSTGGKTVTVYVPSGTYITEPLYVQQSGIGILMDPGATLKLKAGTYNAPLQGLSTGVVNFYGQSGSRLSQVGIMGGTVDGNKANVTNSGDQFDLECVSFEYCDLSWAVNVKAINGYSDGFDWDECADCYAINCWAEDCGGWGFHPSTNSVRIRMVDCDAVSCGADRSRGGFDQYTSVTDCTFLRCRAIDCYQNFDFDGSGAHVGMLRSEGTTTVADDFTGVSVNLDTGVSSSALGDLSDVDTTGATADDLLVFDGADWVVGDPRDTGHYEVVVSGSGPPVAVSTEADDDWVYGWIS